ncbi:hypothetical protein [Paraburkholderia sp. GAS334]|jgi:hypothetical protein|uniref:hypothetical protein n=1 Tax=Paraburkholderia sp. GAS334 TaxID=3035131 RepID=UPI003D200D94
MLFGVKGASLDRLKMYDWIASADSMAFAFGARVKARQGGISNSMVYQSGEMTRWMQNAQRRANPAAGDQFRLPLAA